MISKLITGFIFAMSIGVFLTAAGTSKANIMNENSKRYKVGGKTLILSSPIVGCAKANQAVTNLLELYLNSRCLSGERPGTLAFEGEFDIRLVFRVVAKRTITEAMTSRAVDESTASGTTLPWLAAKSASSATYFYRTSIRPPSTPVRVIAFTAPDGILVGSTDTPGGATTMGNRRIYDELELHYQYPRMSNVSAQDMDKIIISNLKNFIRVE